MSLLGLEERMNVDGLSFADTPMMRKVDEGKKVL